jgi:hypothetical protein
MKPTKKQVNRWYIELWARATRYDGYQPWGYDMPTLKATKPGFVRDIQRLKGMYKSAD